MGRIIIETFGLLGNTDEWEYASNIGLQFTYRHQKEEWLHIELVPNHAYGVPEIYFKIFLYDNKTVCDRYLPLFEEAIPKFVDNEKCEPSSGARLVSTSELVMTGLKEGKQIPFLELGWAICSFRCQNNHAAR